MFIDMSVMIMDKFVIIMDNIIDQHQIFAPKMGGFYFYSLSMNSSAVGGSGLRPFLFRISAISVA